MDTFQNGEFDQIYHEHMFYFSVLSISALMQKFDFELLDFFHSPVHGGSGIFICGKKGRHTPNASVQDAVDKERSAFQNNKIFHDFKLKIESNKIKAKKLIKKKMSQGKVLEEYAVQARQSTVFSYYD